MCLKIQLFAFNKSELLRNAYFVTLSFIYFSVESEEPVVGLSRVHGTGARTYR